MTKVEHICLIALTAAAAFVAAEGGLFFRDLRVKAIPQLVQAETDADRSFIVLGATAGNIERSTRLWQTKESQVADQALAATSELNSSLRGLDVLLFTANVMLERQGRSLESLEGQGTALLSHTDAQIADLSHAIQPIALNLDTAVKNAGNTALLLNSSLSRTLPDLEMTAHDVQGMAFDGHVETSLIVDKTKEALKPRNKWLSILQIAGGGAVNGLEAFYYLTH